MSQRDLRRHARGAMRAALALLAAVSLTCGGGTGTGNALSTLRGRVWYGGPLVGAKIEAWQLVEGTRTLLLAETTTDERGGFEVAVDGYQHIALDAIGGRYDEAAGGGAVTLPADRVLRGVALDVVVGEERDDVAVTPLTEVVYDLAQARYRAGQPFNEALPLVRERMTVHLDFDPTSTAIGELGGALTANADASQHALVLAGLSVEAARAAADLRVTAQDVNVEAFNRVLRDDASSTEARLDGNASGGAAPLHVGANCPSDMVGDRASCRVHSNTLRARLAHGVLSYLVSQGNRTGLARNDVLAWVTGLARNADAELFGGDPVDDLDEVGPQLTWVRPAIDAAVAGIAQVEVTAIDDLGVDQIAVVAVAAGTEGEMTPTVLATLADTDPSPGRFVGTLDTVPLSEGPVVLLATATDVSGVDTEATRAVVVNNITGGTISGVVVKGRIDGATVRVFRYLGGVRGAQLGMGTTDAEGRFTNVTLADGYAGPLLVEAGFGGRYAEEAGPANVTLDVADALRTLVPSYADGGAPSNVVVSPLTSFAVTYREQLAAAQGAQDVPAQWTTAAAAIQQHVGVANIVSIVPLRPEDMTTLTAGARYGLVLIGLSEIARQASTAGGGDAGTFGVASSSLKVWKLWQQDLADGCWNGRNGVAVDAPRLFYGGTVSLGDDPTRRGLASAVAGYLTSGRNATPFAGIADVLPLLDVISTGGGAPPLGGCAGGTLLPPTTATGFDQAPPVITITPALLAGGADPIVRGLVPVVALAVDPDGIDTRPTLRVTGPIAFVDRDDDGDATDADVRFTVDTLAAVGGEGTLTLSFESVDDSSNRGTASRRLVVDNVPPVVTVDGVAEGGAYDPPRTITYVVADSHPASTVATLDGQPFASGAAVVGPGLHTFSLVARDVPGNMTTVTRTFRIDGDDPVITVTGVTDGGFHQPPVTIAFTIVDADLDTSGATLDGAAFLSGTAVSAEGPHRLVVTARDHAGHEVTKPVDFTLDSINPVIAIAGVDAAGVHAPPRTVTYGAVDANLLSVTATLDGAAFVSGAAVSAVGDHVLVVTARDKAGHQVQVSRAFAIDSTPPLVSISGVLDQGFHIPPVTIRFAAMDPHLAAVTATLDGMPILDNTAIATEGPHDLVVTARDQAGLETVATRHFTLDGTRPTVSIDPDLLDGGFYRRQAAVAYAGADANLLSVTATLDGAPFASGAGIQVDGSHRLIVTATDKAGNTAPLDRTFTIDGVAPVITINGVVDGGFYRPGAATVTFTQQETNPGTLTATLDGQPFVSGTAIGGADGPRTLVVTAVDRAGNQTQATRAFTLDDTRPTVSIDPDLLDGGFYRRQAAVAYAGADLNFLSITATLDGAPFASGAGIQVDGAHRLIVTATDKAGNTAPLDRTFTIDGTPPQPTIAGIANNAFTNAASVTLTFGQNDANPGTTTATLNGQPVAQSPVTIVAEGAYDLLVTATDLAGNAAQLNRRFTIDRTAPTVTITGVVANQVYKSGFSIQYTAADLFLAPGQPTATLTCGANPPRAFGSPGQVLNTDAGDCVLRVAAVDLAGNAAPVPPLNFKVDDIAPTVVINGIAQDAFTRAASVTLTFGQNDTNPGTTTATLNSQPVAGSPVAVVAEDVYELVVTATDLAGNVTTDSRRFTIDRTAPTVTITGVVANQVYKSGFSIQYTAADLFLAPGQPTATLTCGANPPRAFGSPGQVLNTDAGDCVLRVAAVDLAGNAAPVPPLNFKVDDIAPTVVINGIANNAFTNAASVTLAFGQNDANPGMTTATLNGQPVAQSPVTVVAEGVYELVVTATDKAGNVTTDSRRFTIDRTDPVITITEPVLNGTAYRSPKQLQFAAADPYLVGVASGTLTCGANPPRPVVNNALASATDAGLCTLVVTARDQAGNAPTLSRTFYIDDAKPVITIAGVAGNGYYREVSPTITVTDLTPLPETVRLDGAPYTSGTLIATEGAHTLTVDAIDRAGNTETASVIFTIDRTDPVVTLNPVGLTDYNSFLWTITEPTVLRATVADLNFAEVHAVVPFNPDVPGVLVVPGGNDWTFTIPAGKIATAAPGTVISIIATDRAGNATPLPRTFRYDANDPVIAMQETNVKDESADGVSFTTVFNDFYGVFDTTIKHQRSTTATPTSLGLAPNVACAMGAPRVKKYAYLLDQVDPAYVVEELINGTPQSHLDWQFTANDDGIGVDPAAVEYRVRDVGANAVVLDWTPLATAVPGSYFFTLYRRGSTAPSIPVLGTKSGFFEVSMRARDRAGRVRVVTHCWDHQPLVPPLDVPATQVQPATNGSASSGKYALSLLKLEDATTPIDPIGTQVLNDAPADGSPFGTGLIEFPVYNATTEPVYLTIDLTKPGPAPYTSTVVLGKRTIDTISGSADCGPSRDADGDQVPADTSKPYCLAGGIPAPLPGSSANQNGTIDPIGAQALAATYGVRVWEQLANSTFTEITQNCPGCNQASPAGKLRLTVRLPARAAPDFFGRPSPQRKFWIMPVIKTIEGIRPGPVGPYDEFSASGTILTGKRTAYETRCASALNSTAQGRWVCNNAKRDVSTFNALKAATLSVPGEVAAAVMVSFDGAAPARPPHLTGNERAASVQGWTTTEPTGL